MKIVLLLISTDQFSLPLIRYLALEGKRYGWRTCIGSMLGHDPERIKEEKCVNDFIFVNIRDLKQCDHAIRKADLIIGMLPAPWLLQITERCIVHGKSLITPSAIDPQRLTGKFTQEENRALILTECGFSPGLDHVTARKAIDSIQRRGGEISSFKTFSGSVIANDCIDNPWEFKLTEPVIELINLGKLNNRHLMHGEIQNVPYNQLFTRAAPVSIPGLDNAIAIPEGDALYYQKIYALSETATVVKGKVVRNGFDQIWKLMIKLGLTDMESGIAMNATASFYSFLNSLLPYSESETLEHRLVRCVDAEWQDIEKLKWLGFFDKECINGKAFTSPAAILQHLLENKLSLKPEDKDCVVMQHQLEYKLRDVYYSFEATMVAEGENKRDSALAKAIGLTTGAAAKSFLLGNIKLKGWHIPATKEIYDPVLQELDDLGVNFHFNERKVYAENRDMNYNLNFK